MKNWKKAAVMGCLAAVLAAAAAVTGCQKKEAQVIIYSNADDEAVEAMKHALDGNGYGGKYFIPDLWHLGAGRQIAGRRNGYRG